MNDAALYQAAIVQAARAGADHPRLDEPRASATVDNPLCGDRVTVDVRLAGEVLEAAGQRVRGCLLCEAAAALVARHAPGCERGSLRGLRARVAGMLSAESDEEVQARARALPGPWPALALFAPVHAYKSRHECVLLPFEALEKALEAAGDRPAQ